MPDVKEFMRGCRMDPTEAEALEARVSQNPDDVESRTLLVGFYLMNRKTEAMRAARLRHVLWMLEHFPMDVSPFVHVREGEAGREGWEAAKRIVLENVNRDPQNFRMLRAAADFFTLPEPDLAEGFLERGRTLQPDDPEWPRQLAHLHNLHRHHLEPQQLERRNQRVWEESEAALQRAPPEQRILFLADAALAAVAAGAWDTAARYGAEMVDALPELPHDWNYGNVVHIAHLVLGRVALHCGDLAAAKEHLLRSGGTPGSPQLNSFGPHMELAQELLERGERDVVLQYLESCGNFWKEPPGMPAAYRHPLPIWRAEILAGGTPNLNDKLGTALRHANGSEER